MRSRKLLTAACGLFVVLNTAYFWQYSVGFLLIPITMLLGGAFVLMVLIAIGQLLLKVKGPADKSRFTGLAATVAVLVIIWWRPMGLIDFKNLMEEEDLLVATREGVANCTTTLRCKKSGSFYIENVCFGMEKMTGHYALAGDTLFLQYDDQKPLRNHRPFAIQKKDTADGHVLGEVLLYENAQDTVPLLLRIKKNGMLH